MLTKRYFVRVAEILKKIPDIKTRVLAYEDFAQWFAEENDAFDKSRFKEACGIVGENRVTVNS